MQKALGEAEIFFQLEKEEEERGDDDVIRVMWSLFIKRGLPQSSLLFPTSHGLLLRRKRVNSFVVAYCAFDSI